MGSFPGGGSDSGESLRAAKAVLWQAVVLVFGLVIVFQGNASADSVSAYLDLTYTDTRQKTDVDPGGSTDTTTRVFRQRYSLSLSKSISPTINLSASGLFDQAYARLITNGVETTSRTTLTNPYLRLSWSDVLLSADFSYNKNKTDISQSGFEKITNVLETYTGRLGWKPVGLPPLDLYFSHSNAYDATRLVKDTTTDLLSWTSVYEPLRGLNVNLNGSYIDSQDKLRHIETKLLGNDLKADYAHSFFSDRLNLDASYEIAQSTVDVTAKGSGEVVLPVSPFAGLSSVASLATPGALDPNPFLIDGNTTVSAGINIGVPPLGGDARPRNIGLDFLSPTQVNTLFVWISRDQLPSGIANFFSWTVYQSSDNLNWTLVPQSAPASFAQFQSHFEIDFQNVTARYIKVVVSPLTKIVADSEPTFDNPDQIFVTEIQAFNRQPAPEKSQSIDSLNQRFYTNARFLVLERPSLYYTLSYFWTESSTNGLSSSFWTMSNGLNASERLSRVLTASARIERQDATDVTGVKTVNYLYSASLDAVPLRTLSHNLTYSGNTQQLPQGTNVSNAVVLSNIAQLYKGISASLNAGISRTSQFDGSKNSSTTLNAGTTIVPNRRLSLTLNYGYFDSHLTNPAGQGSSQESTSTDLAVSYTPFPTLYLVGEWTWQMLKARSDVLQATSTQNDFLQNYAVNWSPFQGGALIFSFFYNESLRQLDNSRARTYGSTVRWNLTKASYLTFTYNILQYKSLSSAVLSHNRERIFLVEYRLNFL
jgi:hypothetical protein